MNDTDIAMPLNPFTFCAQGAAVYLNETTIAVAPEKEMFV